MQIKKRTKNVKTMDKQYNRIYSRNIGILSESEQDQLHRAKIGIAGIGGVGGLLAERLLRLGIGQLKIIDPGTFEESNLNRQFSSSVTNLGHYKIEEVYRQIKDINPQAKIDCDITGINTDADAIQFAIDCNLVIDEMDFGLFAQSIWLQRAARRGGKHYFFTSAIGFGALIVIFDPKGMTLEEYDDLLPNIDLTTIKKINVPLERTLPVIPSYAPATTCQGLQEIYNGAGAVPTVSIGVGLASILAANEAINIILRKREIVVAPRYTYIDLMDREFIIGEIS